MEGERRDELNAASAQQSSRSSGTYAFFNHSSITLPNNLPPDVDDKLLARHKRKRTSPEDQAILEAAYSRDPKPDKTARLELVKKVALGEKEVQIWFQNRRQTSRRKSRPLLPHEIVQYQLARSGSSMQQAASHFLSDDSPSERALQAEPPKASEICPAAPQTYDPSVEPVSGTESAWRSNEIPSSSLSTSSQNTTQTDVSTTNSATESQPTMASNLNLMPVLVTPPVGSNAPSAYLTGRRSLPSLHVSQSASNNKYEHREILNTGPRLPLKKSSSIVRLSLSYEGNAQITTTDGSSPSPPRASQIMHKSESGHLDYQQIASISNREQNIPQFKPMQRSSSGRSRDSRAWEFWCDKEARGELKDKAEKDASGSAADAIDLLRSTSGRRVLGPLPMKRNSFLFRQSASLKRSKLDPKTNTLQRSSTSLGRLQSRPLAGMGAASKPGEKPSHSSTYISSNDSDKENWSPKSLDQSQDAGSESSSVTERQFAEESSVSHDRIHEAFYTEKSRTSFSSRENIDPEADPELAAFMRGGGSTRSISKAEELDCVQNLLSLSQGNWR